MPGLVPGISLHRFRRTAAWMPGTSPGMTIWEAGMTESSGNDGEGRSLRVGGAALSCGFVLRLWIFFSTGLQFGKISPKSLPTQG